MVFSELLNNLPFYLLLSLFLSYIIWAKFINKNKFPIKTVDDVLEIISIFFIILPTIFGIFFVIFAITSTVTLSFNIVNILDTSKLMVLLFVLVLLYVFLITYTHKKGGIEELKKLFGQILIFYIICITVFLGFIILAALMNFTHLLISLSLILIILVGLALLCNLIIKRVFDLNLFEEFDTKLTKVLIGVLIISFLISFFIIPLVNYENPSDVNYHIYNANYNFRSSYVLQESPFDIWSFGILNSFISHIPLRYDPNIFEVNERGNNNFQLLLNISDQTNLQSFISSFDGLKEFNKQANKHGFSEVILNENAGLILLKFNQQTIKNEHINEIILRGFVKTNLTKDNYSYVNNARLADTCSENGCVFKFNITNNLDLPVIQYEDFILNLDNSRVLNTSNCSISGVTSNFPVNHSEVNIVMRDSGCSGNACKLLLFELETGNTLFEMDLVIDETVVRPYLIKFNKPLHVEAEFVISC